MSWPTTLLIPFIVGHLGLAVGYGIVPFALYRAHVRRNLGRQDSAWRWASALLGLASAGHLLDAVSVWAGEGPIGYAWLLPSAVVTILCAVVLSYGVVYKLTPPRFKTLFHRVDAYEAMSEAHAERRRRDADEIRRTVEHVRIYANILSTVVGAVPDTAVLGVDLDKRVLVAGGRPLVDAGWDPSEMLGRTIPDILSQRKNVESIVNSYDSALRGTECTSRYERVNADTGASIVYETTYVPVRDGDRVVGAVALGRVI